MKNFLSYKERVCILCCLRKNVCTMLLFWYSIYIKQLDRRLRISKYCISLQKTSLNIRNINFLVILLFFMKMFSIKIGVLVWDGKHKKKYEKGDLKVLPLFFSVFKSNALLLQIKCVISDNDQTLISSQDKKKIFLITP